jgi:hypothetical protein
MEINHFNQRPHSFSHSHLLPFKMLSLQLLIALSASLTISGARAEYKQAYEACVTLSRILPEQVSFPQSQGYEESISSYAYIGTRLRPACIVSPKTTRDVVATIRTLGTFESVPFAIRSGGHNTNIGYSDYGSRWMSHADHDAGFANVQNGVTMDLSQMNSVTFENPAKTVSVGPGARWQSVYDTLDPYGLSVQGGRNGRVGVGGFLTGGLFSPIYILWSPTDKANLQEASGFSRLRGDGHATLWPTSRSSSRADWSSTRTQHPMLICLLH